jgi:hypothetical protein
MALGSLGKPEAMRAYLDPALYPFLQGAMVPKEITPEWMAGHLEKSLLRLDQNYLILTVALFETLMKDIHRAILRQTPTLLRGDRLIHLGAIVAKGTEAIIEEEIEREVLAIDRKSVQERVRYFDERLRVSWGPSEVVDHLVRIVGLRNRILHEEPDEPVPADVLSNLAGWVLVVSGFACQDVDKHYPSVMTEQDRGSLSNRPFDKLSDAISKAKQASKVLPGGQEVGL